MHYDLEILPDDRGTLAKYNSDVLKWHLFSPNITEDEFELLTETFALYYTRSLRFQTVDATEVVEPTAQPTPAAATDEVLKVFFCIMRSILKMCRCSLISPPFMS